MVSVAADSCADGWRHTVPSVERVPNPEVFAVRLKLSQIAGYAQYYAHFLHRQYLADTKGKPMRIRGFNANTNSRTPGSRQQCSRTIFL